MKQEKGGGGDDVGPHLEAVVLEVQGVARPVVLHPVLRQ